MAETVKVMVRCRPMNKQEIAKNCQAIIDVDTKKNSITINSKEGGVDGAKTFTYDCVFSTNSIQQNVYESTAFPLVESVVEGYNGTIFAYGQTGCGKTHSMVGIPTDEVEKGIIPRTFSHLINIVESANDRKFLIRCSYIEIYNEEIHDLLAKDCKAKLELKESPDKGVFIKDVTMNVVKSIAEMDKWMSIGTDNRSVGATAMNKDSSRSHSLFTLYIECQIKSEIEGQDDSITAGKLNLVDLAGSERQSKTQATGDRLKEATKINLSLSALGNVISALVDGKTQHIPYRDSKLTRLLQDSLGGNTKTIMIAAISPADYNYDETLSTLRYASRAKNIKNQPKVNQDPKDAMLKEYQEEIKKLKEIRVGRNKENCQKIKIEIQISNVGSKRSIKRK
ncbi:kinesin family member 17, putative [Ichthyophthirius multifiliis]|uniref:Kinesin-like protein n=1 Tax=Ichthyophthirius multifiliis TaxID=5932 RepID=G0QJD1_ICHMU|nr:kinesin family member 17, putative [Ichthyophthirius multifiliis]EGR34671.1 kinesin family member 17, putative [Ichthyophthirius multifiliis]|eukprot:XP_004039975.1 kinesin family member 17, putative [Ichthyophthirius multifiliis]